MRLEIPIVAATYLGTMGVALAAGAVDTERRADAGVT
jgi:hypothetical protein